MAPIRRYLRITKYSVLECRIYLDNPALSETWLLRKADPVLPRIIEAIRPMVLPKLREENERAKTKGRGKSKNAIKDVIVQDDFEVSIFLKDQSSRHSLLTKQKDFSEKPRLKSNSTKLTNWLITGTNDKPITVEDDDIVMRQEDDEHIDLDAVPEAPNTADDRVGLDSDDALFISSNSEDEAFQTQRNPSLRRRRPQRQEDEPPDKIAEDGEDDAGDDKKKLGLQTMYDGFAIYGRILCLIVKRRGMALNTPKSSSSHAMMENWVSTQVAQEMGIDQEA